MVSGYVLDFINLRLIFRMKQIFSSVVSPRLVLNISHRYAEEENTRSASVEVGGTVSNIW